MKKIAIVGASGFIGSALVKHLRDKNLSIVALGRSFSNHQDKNVLFQQADLFSMLDIEKGLEGVDTAIYLVHSMAPSSHLAQGDFEDYDLILADNFIRAAEKKGVKHTIYLSGMIPQSGELSRHLKSRLEVEELLKASAIPSTSLRAAIVIGPGGSSFSMIQNLVNRLPLMICPSWTKSLSCPVSLETVLKNIEWAINNPAEADRIYDLSGSEKISYIELLELAAMVSGKKRFFTSVPFMSPTLSKLWVSVFSGAPMRLVSPLVESLKHDLVPVHTPPIKESRSLKEIIESSLNSKFEEEKPHAFYKTRQLDEEHLVQSVQRFPLPAGKSADWVAHEYTRWLNDHLTPFVSASEKLDVVTFRLGTARIPLLVLEKSAARSSSNRVLFYVTGGLLSRKTRRGRLEFRESRDGKYVIAAIHDFSPTLPWYLYKGSQAVVHLWVMKEFGKHLDSLIQNPHFA